MPQGRDTHHFLHLPHALELRTVRIAQRELVGGIEAPDDQAWIARRDGDERFGAPDQVGPGPLRAC